MVVVGADVHKQTHTFVAVDEVGRQVGQLTAKATSEGHAKAWAWATREFGAELVWAIEDCRHLSARLERDLLTAGQRVVRVPPKMMAEQRRIARTRGTSDPIDALAVARAFLREPGLAVASHDEVSRELKLLVARRHHARWTGWSLNTRFGSGWSVWRASWPSWPWLNSMTWSRSRLGSTPWSVASLQRWPWLLRR